MTPADIDRVFGRSRLRMVTGEHVEVFREASLPGERRRYTKRFLATAAGDFRPWTEREWRILARLVGHGIGPVPDVVQFDRGASDRPALVQTYDAGITVDHWATLLPVERAGATRHHVFEDCAHWWALARHCLIALDAIHQLQLVHLDLKADNVCIPAGPADFDPHAPDALLHLRFEQITLIDFAFSLVSGERLDSALPIARQTEYDYQSPRLLQALEAGAAGDLAPTRQLDWRCDIFSLAAMLRRYLPDPERAAGGVWTPPRLAQARALIRRLLDVHDAELPVMRPHADLVALASVPLQDDDLAASLQGGWTLATGYPVPRNEWPTPVTRIAMPVVTGVDAGPITIDPSDIASRSKAVDRPQPRHRRTAWAAALVGLAASVPLFGHQWLGWPDWIADPAPSPSAGSKPDDIRNPPPAPAPATVAMAPRADTPRKALDAATPHEAASAPKAASVPPAPARPVDPPAEQTSPSVAESAESQTTAPTSVRPAVPSSESRVGETARPPDPASTTPARVPAVAPKRAAAPSAGPTVSARTGKAMPGEAPRIRAGLPVGKPPGVASANARSAAQERTATREAVRAPASFAGADHSKTRTAVPTRSGAPAAARVASATATAKRDPGSKPAAPFVAAPVPAAAPEPWPHTAMASGIASAKSPADARRAAPAVPAAPRSPSQPVVPAHERTVIASASAPTPPPTGNAAPAVLGATVRPGVTPPLPPDWTAEPTDPIGARPSTSDERGRIAPPVFVPSPAVQVTEPQGRVAVLPDFAARAGDVIANRLPRIAQRAERSVMKVLFTAARSDGGALDDEIRQAASAMRRAPDDALADLALAAGDARQLNDAARVAFYRRGSAREAADLQLRAFGANPTDPEVVGNLAFLRLKQPAQADSARQLALHALTLPDARFPYGRLEDWTTFAIASALAGRERDARNAWWVTAVLAPSLQRQCRAATDAYALYGDRLRPSVESMLQRLHTTGRLDGTAFCSWPPYWTVGSNR